MTLAVNDGELTAIRRDKKASGGGVVSRCVGRHLYRNAIYRQPHGVGLPRSGETAVLRAREPGHRHLPPLLHLAAAEHINE
jgi:hypothetical protein